MSKIYVPATGLESWQGLLADPVKHWRTGYSAKALAACWDAAEGFPPEVGQALRGSLGDLEMLLAIPEHQVPLPGGSRPSQNDLFVLAGNADGLVAIAVEGKVAEPFDQTVEEWLRGAPAASGKGPRLQYLCDRLGLAPAGVGHLRYQLLHRTVSALDEARRFHARAAVMLVHSFSPTAEWYADFEAFAKALCGSPTIGALTNVGSRGGIDLHLGWVTGDARFLTA